MRLVHIMHFEVLIKDEIQLGLTESGVLSLLFLLLVRGA